MRILTAGAWRLAACGWLLACAAEGQVSVVSNRADVPGDFSQVHAALAAGAVEIALIGGGDPYATVRIDRRVRIFGQDGPAVLTKVEVAAGGDLGLAELIVGELSVDSGRASVSACLLDELSVTGLSEVVVQGSLIRARAGGGIALSDGARGRFVGNLIILDSAGSGFFSDWRSWVNIRHNTIVDPAGLSEWVIYQGDFINNVVTFRGERFARFDVEVVGNISTVPTFEQRDSGNLQGLAESSLFQDSSFGYGRYEPLVGSPALRAGVDGATAGLSGGPEPMDWGRLPGEFFSPVARLRGLFGQGLSGDGAWIFSSWFGWFIDLGRDGIYHAGHHFLYPVGKAASLYFYDFQLGRWFWSGQEYYPYVYVFGQPAGWYYYLVSTQAPGRIFYDIAADSFIGEERLLVHP